MSANAYPARLSGTTFSQSDNDNLHTGTTNLATGSGPSDQTETQATLQQASVSLEAVYRRIRQFRRSLQEVADSASSGEWQSRPSAEDNLTGVREPSFLILQDNSYVSAAPQPSIEGPPRIRRLNRDLPPLTTLPPTPDTSSSSSSPASQAPYPHLSRSMLENWFQRNREYPADDAETTLGRRVAAREAARASTTDSDSIPLTRFEGSLIQLVVNMEREFDHLRQQRSELSRTFPLDTRSAPLYRRTVELRRQLAAQNREAGSPANSSLVPPPDLLRRRLTGFPSSRSPTMSSWSERLSLLSNFSVQNLPTPVSTGSSRPLLFEEPISYLQGPEDSNESRSGTFSNESGLESDRSYVVRRRLNTDGEEHVHPISLLEWPDEPLTFAGQGRTQREQPEVVSHRRRGWARLDPDGNEIPVEQEEELERARSEYRLQVRTADSGVRLTTLTSLTPDNDDGRIPRVRLSSFARRRRDDVNENKGLGRHGPASPSKPFCPCPLPTPLENMNWSPPPCKPLRGNRVSKHASFAGR
ncbi:hypothetical protein C0993_005828 [Termitomyces sp. T159_Od127]|nr:hypothetical protein C0993_005828 [Termitomyces sp. T159_Od127]